MWPFSSVKRIAIQIPGRYRPGYYMPSVHDKDGEAMIDMIKDYIKYANKGERAASEMILQFISDKALVIRGRSLNKEQDAIKEGLIKAEKIMRSGPERVVKPINANTTTY
jgi:hypothetical protein